MGTRAIERYETALADASELMQDAAGRLETLQDELRDEIEQFNAGQIQELARIRFLLKDSLRGDAEKCTEGRERLERVLDELDSSWRTLA